MLKQYWLNEDLIGTMRGFCVRQSPSGPLLSVKRSRLQGI